MRLQVDPIVYGLSPERVIVLTRHGVDVPHLTQELNQPLTEETKPDIVTLGREIVQLAQRLKVEAIDLRHSTRLRGIQTATILAEEFFKASIPTDIQESPGIREIYQGEFLIKNYCGSGEYRPLVDAWTAWQERLNQNELLYRFGEPGITGEGREEYPHLKPWFTKFGENQAEFSWRLYSFLREILADHSSKLCVVVAHQASCSRMQRIFNALSRLQSTDEFTPGDFVRNLEKQGDRVTINPASGTALRKPDWELGLAVIDKELSYLKSIL